MSAKAGQVEGDLLGGGPTRAELLVRHAEWVALGLGRILAPPNVLGDLPEAAEGGPLRVGAVGGTSGCHTLATKQMEALECLRLGAGAVVVMLDPYRVAGGEASEIEREMAALRKTTPELEVGFSSRWPLPAPGPLEVLLRVLRSVRPPSFLLCGSEGSPDPQPETLARIRQGLHRKVALGVSLRIPTAEAASAALASGCTFIRTADPGRVLGARP